MPIYEEKRRTEDGQKRYYIRAYVTDEDGEKRQVTKHNQDWFGKNGKILAQQEEIRLKNKIYVDSNKGRFNYLTKLYFDEIKSKVKESTYISYQENVENQLTPFFKNKIISYDLILSWHNTMLKNNKLSISYLNKINTVLKNILDVGIKYQLLDRNYVKDIGPFSESKNNIDFNKDKLRYIDLEDFKRFIKESDSLLWYTVFNLLYYTGMRKGELLALTWKDIDFNNQAITINKTYTDRTKDGLYKITTTKNYQSRIIAIDNHTTEILKKWYENELKDNFNINNFVFGRTSPISTTTMTNKKNKYFKLAGFSEPFITIHEFRHSHVSLLINEYLKNKNTDTTKFFIMMSSRMGHTIQVMQETYMHLFPDVQAPIINLLNGL